METINDKKLCEVYKLRDTHLLNEIAKYTKELIEKEKDNKRVVLKDKHVINDSYTNSEY
jgi:hypothetical protein